MEWNTLTRIGEREPSQALKDQVKARDGYRCLCCGEDNRRVLQIDHVAPVFFGGSNTLDNLQTLCGVCNRHKDIQQINFRHNRTLLTTPPASWPTLPLPNTEQAKTAEDWGQFLQLAFNCFYRCAAVDFIHIGKRGGAFYHWEIALYAGNDPAWLVPYLPNLLQQIRDRRSAAGRQGPEGLRIAARIAPRFTMPSSLTNAGQSRCWRSIAPHAACLCHPSKINQVQDERDQNLRPVGFDLTTQMLSINRLPDEEYGLWPRHPHNN